MLKQGKRDGIEERKGPVGLFICGTYNSGVNIEDQLTKLVYGSKLVTYVTNGTEAHGKLKAKLCQNPEFMIVTANFVGQLYDKWFEYFRFERYFSLSLHKLHIRRLGILLSVFQISNI